MDSGLEFVDTFIGDYVFAYLLPIGRPNKMDTNSSTEISKPWIWQPASVHLHFQPSEAAYMSSLTRDNPYRQFITLYFITWLFGTFNYFITATFFYYLNYDKRAMNHPKFKENQIWVEIKMSFISFPIVAILMTPLFVLEVRGYAKLYDAVTDGPGWWYSILQIPLFILFTEFCTYWIHRLSHRRQIYSHFLYMHKIHHKFIIPTPYASYAIHPIEAFTLALPYHIFPFILPLQKAAHAALYMFVNVWVIGLHDGKFLTTNRIVNGAAAHSLHHTHRDCNYGQFLTLFDRLHGTYHEPEALMSQKERLLPKKGSLDKCNKNNNNGPTHED